MVLHSRGGTMQGGGDVNHFPPQMAGTNSVVDRAYQENMNMAQSFQNSYLDMAEALSQTLTNGMNTMANTFARQHSRISDSALRVPFPNSSQGGGIDGFSDWQSRLSDRSPRSASTNTGTPESEKTMPARDRRSHPHVSRDSPPDLSPVDEEEGEEVHAYVVESFARAPSGVQQRLFPPPNASVSAEEER